MAGPEGLVIVGVDVPKDAEVIEHAYNDRAGVTARFNRNLLERINRELHGDFDVKRFAHRAEWQAEPCRVEMQLVSEVPQRVVIGGRAFDFGAGEAIITEQTSLQMVARALRGAGRASGPPVGRGAVRRARVGLDAHPSADVRRGVSRAGLGWHVPC